MAARHTFQVVTDPDGFFAERASELPLRYSVAIVSIVALINVGNSLLLSSTIDLDNAFGEIAFTVANLFGLIAGVVGVFALWLLYTAAFYVLSIPFDGSGTFRDLFKLVGWGFVPNVLGSLVSLGLTWYVLDSLPEGMGPQELAQAYQSHPVIETVGLVGIVFLLWQWMIWTFSVQEGRGLELKEAAFVTAVPVAVNLGFALMPYV